MDCCDVYHIDIHIYNAALEAKAVQICIFGRDVAQPLMCIVLATALLQNMYGQYRPSAETIRYQQGVDPTCNTQPRCLAEKRALTAGKAENLPGAEGGLKR
jgi:hypothetical protein